MLNNELATDRSQKLLPKRKGPYEVLRMVTAVTYKIKLLEKPYTILLRHRNLLLPFYSKDKILPKLVNKHLQGYIPTKPSYIEINPEDHLPQPRYTPYVGDNPPPVTRASRRLR